MTSSPHVLRKIWINVWKLFIKPHLLYVSLSFMLRGEIRLHMEGVCEVSLSVKAAAPAGETEPCAVWYLLTQFSHTQQDGEGEEDSKRLEVPSSHVPQAHSPHHVSPALQNSSPSSGPAAIETQTSKALALQFYTIHLQIRRISTITNMHAMLLVMLLPSM